MPHGTFTAGISPSLAVSRDGLVRRLTGFAPADLDEIAAMRFPREVVSATDAFVACSMAAGSFASEWTGEMNEVHWCDVVVRGSV